jgi:hypothetical protein
MIYGETTLVLFFIKIDENDTKDLQKKIAKDIIHFQSTCKSGWFASLGAVGNNQCYVYIFIDPIKCLKISNMVANAWGIDNSKLVTVSLIFSNLYTDSNKEPIIDSFQSGNSDIDKLTGKELNSKSTYGLYWTICNKISKDFFGKQWPITTFNENQKKKKKDTNYLHELADMINVIKI